MRRLLVILLVAPISLGGVAYAIGVVGAKPSLTFSVSPVAQAVVRGGAADFSVDVKRSRGFAGRATLGVARLPAGVRARWQLADGTRARVLTSDETGATLTLRSSSSTTAATRRVIVWATAAGRTARRRLTLTVVRPGRPGFSIRASPARQAVAAGTAARYRIRVARTRFGGRVRLRVLRAPTGLRARFSGGVLKVTTKARSRETRRRLVIAATALVHGRRMHRYAVVALTVVNSDPFSITGDLATNLSPGVGAPLDLVLTNPHDFDLRITALSVSVRGATTNPGCSGEAGYGVAQFAGTYPVVLAPGSSRLSALVPDSSLWPQVSMRNLPTNQDACKGAVITLDYSGLATR